MTSRLLPLVILIVAIGLFFGYINPTRTGAIADSKARIASYDSALAAADSFKKKEAELTVAEANIPSDSLARLNAFLPDGVDNVQIILDLNTLAARSGVTLADFQTTGGTTSDTSGTATTPGAVPATGAVTDTSGMSLQSEGPIDSLEISMNATGTYANFRTFLDGIESSLRLLDIESIDVKDSQTGVYTYTVKLRLYWLR